MEIKKKDDVNEISEIEKFKENLAEDLRNKKEVEKIPGVERFKKILECLPKDVQNYFDLKNKIMSEEIFKQDFGCRSSGEKVMIKFACDVFTNENNLIKGLENVNIIVDFRGLDFDNLKVIKEWFNNPFFM
jgi:hypothetical protein